MILTKEIEAEVLEVYDTWLQSYLTGDVKTYDHYFDDAYRFIGSTDNEEFLSPTDAAEFLRVTADQFVGKTQHRNEVKTLESFGELVFLTHFFDAWFLSGEEWTYYGRFRFTSILRDTDAGWCFIYQHFSTPDSKAQEGETIGYDQISAENLQLREAIKRRTIELENKNLELEIEAALERIRAKVTAMKESTDLLEIVVTMRSEFTKLGHQAYYFWHMRWLPDTYQKAMTSGDGTRIGMVMELPRHMHGDIPLLASWEQGEEPTVVYAMDAEAAVDYVDKMVSLGNFQQIDPQAPSADDIRHIGGLTFVMARTTHGEIGYSLPGVVSEPPAEDLATLERFAGVFDLAYRRFEDLKESERQRREAEIELALERVRARTLAMQKSEELADAAFVLFEQLRSLGGNLWGTGFGLCEKDRETDQFWFAYEKGVLPPASVPNTTDPAHKQMYKGWKGKKDFLAIEASGEALIKHYQYMMSLDEVRPFFQEILDKGLSFPEWQQWNAAYFTHGYLLVITLEPYPEPDILRRFARVFEQTYTRFLDLQKAEAQARESEIQLALERVRASTMAMQHSEELSDVLSTLFQQFDILGINPSHAVLTLIDKEKNTLNFRTTGTNGYRVVAEQEVDLAVTDAWIDTEEKWKKSEPNAVNVNEYPPEVLPEVWAVYADILAAIPEKARPKIEDFPDGLFITEGYCRFGYIGFAHNREPTEEEKDIVQRMASEFGTLYQRFLDLQKAEAQAREAQIEAALEKVRTRTMAMQKGEELKEVAVLLYKELIALGVTNFVTCGYVEVNEEIKRQFTWVTSPGGDTMGLFYLPLNGDATFDERYDAWKRQQTIFHQTVAGEVRNSHLEYAITTFNSKEAEEMVRSQFPDPTVFYCFNFSHGYLHLVCPTVLKEEEEVLLARFTRVFEQTYARFLDLKKAEAQAREAQIENALEKVRSRTMAMQHSDELPEAANVLFLEIQALGIPAWSCGYNILATDKKSARCWMSSEGTIQKPFTLRLWGEASFEEMGEFVRGDESLLVQELGEKALKEHYDHMLSFPDLLPIFEALQAEGLSLPTNQVNHLCKFNHGFLLFITYEPIPEAHEIFKRFTAVFEQTYTRFLDLKNMEAQARESKIETALERVRARALAMQEPEELKDVVQVLRGEMGLLGVEELETSSIYVNDEQVQKAECWFAIKDIREEEKVMLTDHFELDLNDTWVGREMLEFYKSPADQVSIVMKGTERKEWISYCESHSRAFKGYYGEVIPERTYHLYKFSHGAIGAATPGDLSEESWGLLKRAASVFSLAYSRFKDLTQARLDLKRLKEEKKRAEDALKELQLTQQQLVHAEKMASLGELTAGIAHEIQNPLNFVNNFSEVSRELLEELLEEMKNGDVEEVDAIAQDVIQNLEKIVHHGKRADSIVKGMLQHSRSGDDKMEPTDLNILADEYLRLAYHGLRAKDKSFNATMETDFDHAVGKVEVVPQDIGRVLLNLITNAFHAISERNEKKEEGYEPAVWVATRKNKDGVEISVRDNGGGIPDDIRDKIFQPFFTTKPTGEGTGLGLSMSYDIVTKGHGGQLTVESETGKGTKFLIILPV
ncbi:ATP-binding protein [Robiginitalea aurantiaca]|uniref:histidine kinase n=1 Tax=Robiginitalea aurantiaca TaxID=3056915 RepID=A0ABT7WDE4_9FLAO|nr:ATP-binding protein [Robiginitalea aurantiaca]MDM9630946.1 ATP-binding protein [Robiginitalea aurantiaca]